MRCEALIKALEEIRDIAKSWEGRKEAPYWNLGDKAAAALKRHRSTAKETYYYVVVEKTDPYGAYNVELITLDESEANKVQIELIRTYLDDQGYDLEKTTDGDVLNMYHDELDYYCEVATWTINDD